MTGLFYQKQFSVGDFNISIPVDLILFDFAFYFHFTTGEVFNMSFDDVIMKFILLTNEKINIQNNKRSELITLLSPYIDKKKPIHDKPTKPAFYSVSKDDNDVYNRNKKKIDKIGQSLGIDFSKFMN